MHAKRLCGSLCFEERKRSLDAAEQAQQAYFDHVDFGTVHDDRWRLRRGLLRRIHHRVPIQDGAFSGARTQDVRAAVEIRHARLLVVARVVGGGRRARDAPLARRAAHADDAQQLPHRASEVRVEARVDERVERRVRVRQQHHCPDGRRCAHRKVRVHC